MSFMKPILLLGAVIGLAALGACEKQPHAAQSRRGPAAVDAARMANAASDDSSWMSYGRTYDEQRYSGLSQLDDQSVKRLGLAWSADFDTNRGQEATPLVIDGVMYVSTAWSMVKAYDAETGKMLWSFDPAVPREWGVNACCDAVNRGVAAWEGKIFVGTLDGRLIALDASTGKPVWEKNTIDRSKPYTITGAPRIVKGKVLIGNGGAEYGVRGYISAYDADSGASAWRFYTVPGDPSKPFESPILAKAAKTWFGKWWELGGGGTVWDSMAYDPKLDLLYIGTGNGSPWSRKVRSEGKGDNLFLSSIVALRPDTGEYVWHYQTTPGDEWDYTATQHIMLADLKIDGKLTPVLMQAPKNGFFYVLDRRNGKLLSAKPFMPLNWATGVDLKTGLPQEVAAARYSENGKPWMAMPSSVGGHSWHPMAFSPKTGLVYIPTQEMGGFFDAMAGFKASPKGWNTGVKFSDPPFPTDPKVIAMIRASLKGYVVAWDPIGQKVAFKVSHQGPLNGGMLATGGNLLFQGDATGHFNAYRADNGTKLWQFDAQSAITAAPITYSIGGTQYVAVVSGWGGLAGMMPGQIADVSGRNRNVSRLLVFRLDGAGHLPAPPAFPEQPQASPIADVGTATQIEGGRMTFSRYCSVCHGADGVSAGLVPDLRYSGALSKDPFYAVVRDGVLKDAGMASFADALSPKEMEALRLYLAARSREAAAAARH